MFKQLISDAIEARKAAYKAHRQKIEDRAEELNAGFIKHRYSADNIKSTNCTWGKDNRPHAPFDGYLWEHPRTGSVDAYGGGQYLPFTDEFDDLEKPAYTTEHGYWKIRMTQAMYDTLRDNYFYFHMYPPYKSWTQSGHVVFMVEVKAHQSLIETIINYSEDFFAKLYEEEKALKGIAPEGKLRIKATVRSTKIIPDELYGPSVKMMVVLENGSTAYGTLPKAVPLDYRGEIEFNATFTHSFNDITHAFFKRPTKVEIC